MGKWIGTVRAVDDPSKCSSSKETVVVVPLDGGGGPTGSLIGGAGKTKTNESRYIAMFFEKEKKAADEDQALQVVPTCGEISRLHVIDRDKEAIGGPGAFYTFTVRLNKLNTPVTCKMTDPATTCDDDANTVTAKAHDTIDLGADPSVPTDPVPAKDIDIGWTAVFTPVDPDDPDCGD